MLIALRAWAKAQGPAPKPAAKGHTQYRIASQIYVQSSCFMLRKVASCLLFPAGERPKERTVPYLSF